MTVGLVGTSERSQAEELFEKVAEKKLMDLTVSALGKPPGTSILDKPSEGARGVAVGILQRSPLRWGAVQALPEGCSCLEANIR